MILLPVNIKYFCKEVIRLSVRSVFCIVYGFFYGQTYESLYVIKIILIDRILTSLDIELLSLL